MERPTGLKYPVPWDLVFGLTPHIAEGTVASFDELTRRIEQRLNPQPVILGLEHLPENPRFVVVANHYQRKGLWIAHPTSVITQVMRRRYGPGDPPVRWVVTANWPPLRLGSYRIPSPGDVLLPKVARVLSCYPVSFARNNPGFTASSIRRLLRDLPSLDRPLGLFPEGVAGSAGVLTEPLPGVDRLLRRIGWPLLPVGISEPHGAALQFRFGPLVPADAALAMRSIAGLIGSTPVPE